MQNMPFWYRKIDEKGKVTEEAPRPKSEKKLFHVRVDINPHVVYKNDARYLSSQSMIKKLMEGLGDYIESVNIDCCRSFSTFSVMDNNGSAVEENVKRIWRALYPEAKNAIEVNSFIEDGTEMAKVLKEIYAGYFGWAAYIRMVTEMACELPLVQASKASELVMNRNYLISIDEGCGFSTMLSSFSDFMNRVGYLEYSDSGTLEYKISENDDSHDITTGSLFNTLWDDATRERCIGLDISYFLPKEKHDELRTFLKRLYKLQQRYIFLFRIPFLEDKAGKEIYDLIEDVVSVDQLVIEPYSELIYAECFNDIIIKHKIDITDETIELFYERMRMEKRDGRFYGLKTVRKIAEEAMLLKIRHDARVAKSGNVYNAALMNADDIEGILEDFDKKPKNGYDELHELIGMEEIEKKIREIVAQVKLAKANDRLDTPCLHMRFTGAPGTGKTTVARIIGKVFKEEGILRKGSFFEYGARDLCGKYIGQTAPRTAQICRDAYGSVLFLDEAYSLYAGDSEAGQNDYGREAITTLIAEMENHRDDMVIIMAGYTDDMKTLMEANAGLRSRMPYIIEFKSYSREQLALIFMNYVKKHFDVGEGLEEAVKEYFSNISDSYLESKEFANARFVRNLYERTWSRTAMRMAADGSGEYVITVADFNSACSDKEFSEELAVKRRIGF